MILQETDRHAIHFAQVLQMGLHDGPNGPQGAFPEKRYAKVERTPAVPASIVAVAGLALGAGLYWATKRD